MSATSTTSAESAARRPRAAARRSPARVAAVGLVIAVVSAAMFGTSGAVAKSLLVQGWSPGAAVTFRIVLGALLLAPFALWEMRGRWHLLRSRLTWTHVGLFGLLAVAGCQLFYFLAVERLSVGVALMLEYLGPILVVGWLWLVRGQRPRPLTVAGIAVALVGLLLVLDVLGDVQLSTAGVLWGLAAAVGLAVFFVVGADDEVVAGDLAANDGIVAFRSGSKIQAVASIGRDRESLRAEHALAKDDQRTLEALVAD